MGILENMEKDKSWSQMDDMIVLGMTREDLNEKDLAEEEEES